MGPIADRGPLIPDRCPLPLPLSLGWQEASYTLAMAVEVSVDVRQGTGPPVELPGFSGPLDLLLHLVQKNDLSIYDIPIALVCDQFQERVAAMQEVDLEVAGEYLWMAAWLLQLKSKMLLPRPEEGDEDPRQELVERLLEYRRVKELAALLHERDALRRLLWQPAVAARFAPVDSGVEWEDVDLRQLAGTYLRAMQRFAAAHPPPLAVAPLRFRLRDTMRQLYATVTRDGSMPLLRHLHRRADSEEVVVLVVATLELVRLGAVCVEQRRPFAEIYLRPGGKVLDGGLPGDVAGEAGGV